MSLSNQERNARSPQLRDHPVVVVIGTLAGLAGIVGLILEIIGVI